MSITTLTGSNSYQIRRVLASRLDEHAKSHGRIGIERIDGDTLAAEDAAELLARLSSPSLFGPHKLVIIRGPSRNPALTEQLLLVLDNPPSDTDVVIIDLQLDRRSKLYKSLKSRSDFLEYGQLKAPELIDWVVESASSRGGSIGRSEAAFLVERTGLNQERLNQEIDKLLLYDPAVSRPMIEELVEPSIDSTTFNLADAAFARQKARALAIFQEQRQLRVEPVQIIGSLAWQLHCLVLVKAGQDKRTEQIAREAGLNPWALAKARQLVRSVSLQDLTQAVDRLLEIDDRSKTAAVNVDDALQQYLLGI